MVLENDYGIIMNHKKIIKIMKTYNLRPKIRRTCPFRSKKPEKGEIYQNILNRNFQQTNPNTAYCTDITYLQYKNNNTAFLSAIKDIASGEIISYNLSKTLKLDFVVKMLEIAIELTPNDSLEGLIIHSDRGLQFTSKLYQALLKKHGIIQSMSRRANCLDNAPIESFFGHLKDEIDYKNCKTFEELEDLINNYIYDYNNKRYQWNKNKMTPIQYKQYLIAS